MCVYVCVCVLYLFLCMCVHVWVFVCMGVCVCVCVCVNMQELMNECVCMGHNVIFFSVCLHVCVSMLVSDLRLIMSWLFSCSNLLYLCCSALSWKLHLSFVLLCLFLSDLACLHPVNSLLEQSEHS